MNRPFDDQRQTRVRIETEAKLCLQDQIRSRSLELVWSYMLDFENAANPFEDRRVVIASWRQYAIMDVEESEMILGSATRLAATRLKAKDALHVACAIAGVCEYFVTTDDAILARARDVAGIALVDPTTLVREMNL